MKLIADQAKAKKAGWEVRKMEQWQIDIQETIENIKKARKRSREAIFFSCTALAINIIRLLVIIYQRL